MNPLAHYARLVADAYGDWATAPDAPPEPEPAPAPAPPTSYRPEPAYVTAFEMPFRARAADEALVLEALAVETARADSSWEAARTLFAPEGSCAGLYATQTPPERLSRVSVSPDAHRPAQPLP